MTSRINFLLLLLVVFFVGSCSARSFYHIPLPPGAVGPESVAFDPLGRGPYVGVSDGRILRYEGPNQPWTQFAVMPNWSSICLSPIHKPPESVCGRPLGLKFHAGSGMLYVADAYKGLVAVGPQGGRGVSVATSAEGVPFGFTNSLDIDQTTGVVYFTDSSTRFQRWEFERIFETGDDTGRLMAYNPRTHVASVLLRGLRFANGVALSRNSDFVLVAETSTGGVHKFWLRGPRYHASELLVSLRGRPDNINRDSVGNFWIAQVQLPLGRSGDGGMPVRVDEQGRVLERLDAGSGEFVRAASDVREFNGRLWIGSVLNNYVEVDIIP